jgi:cyclohexa-1,5-dienecarbonyl-CoA hydratase
LPEIRVLEIDRPPVNVLTMETLEGLRRGLAGLEGARVLLLRGKGKCFSAGADVGEHLPGKVESMLPLFTRTVEELRAVEIPTIAFLHGAALGGGLELALACDLVVAAEDAKLGFPEITLGVFPPVAAALLPARARALLFTGETVSGSAAAQMGLVHRVGTAEDAAALAERIARHPRPALVACKKALGKSPPEAERIYLSELMTHPEPVEGLRAFLEKRAPRWP